jgi:putative transposase
MPQSLAKVTIHIVFSTKDRRPFLRDPGLRQEHNAYMATILKDNVDSSAILINGVEDHIHALVNLSRKFAIMDVIQEMKTETSKWLKTKSEDTTDFAWQSGYGAFSVSESNIEQVKEYIASQEEHHKKVSFQDEFRAFCKRHNVELDERYVWD